MSNQKWKVNLDLNGKQTFDRTKRFVIPFDKIICTLSCSCPNLRSSILARLILCGDPVSKQKLPICDCRLAARSADITQCSIIKLFFAEETKKNGYKLKNIEFSNVQPVNIVKKSEKTQLLLAAFVGEIEKQIQGKERPKSLLIFVNPYGGTGKALKIFNSKVLPIFDLANINCNTIVTEHGNHARDYILNTVGSTAYDGIVCVGGDGMFTEILNGVIIKTQLNNQVNFDSSQSQLVKPNIPVGVIPAGSTNAVVNSTNGYNCPINSALAIVLGRKLALDVGAVHRRDEEKLLIYSANFMGYGFLGDTLLDSERNRWMGPQRYNWAGLNKFLRHRSYSGELKMCIEPKDGRPTDYNPCSINCGTCKCAGAKSHEKLGADDKPACILVRKQFIAINGATIPCRCDKSKLGVSPMSHLGDGCTDLIVVEKCSRLDYLSYLFRMSFSKPNLFDFDFIHTYRVREFEFTPIVSPVKRKAYTYEKSSYDLFDENLNDTSTPTIDLKKKNQNKVKRNSTETKSKDVPPSTSKMASSVWNIDGEVISEPAIHVKLHCQLVTLYATGVDVPALLNFTR